MKTITLLERHASQIEGVLSCFDRLLLSGSFGMIGHPAAMMQYLLAHQIRLMDYQQSYAGKLREAMAARIRALAAEEGLSVLQVKSTERKEAVVEAILEKRGRHPGGVCVLSGKERCRCFKPSKNEQSGYLELQWRPGQCQTFYVYFIDARFGLCHLRIPTWAPFRLQACCNGHHWLEQRMRAAGITFVKADNCFTHVSDYAAAQALVEEFDPQELHAMLDRAAARWVSVHELFGQSLHWSVYQAEWATDIVFKDDRFLPGLYEEMVRTAAMEVRCPDIYRFFSKRPSARSTAEVSTRLQTLVQGTRLKHTLGPTSLKMYDKAGRVLRIECTTNDISSFSHYRQVEPRRSSSRKADAGSSGAGSGESRRHQYAPMRKTIYSLPALAEAMEAVNRRYLLFAGQWPDRTHERHELGAVTASTRDERDRPHRGVNFFRADDQQFLQALLRGENQIHGLRNRSLQLHLPGWKPSRIGRALRRFRTLKLLKRVPDTRQYYLTRRGMNALVAGKQLAERIVLPAFAA